MEEELQYVLSRVVKQGFLEDVIFEQRPELNKGAHHVTIWGRIIQSEVLQKE